MFDIRKIQEQVIFEAVRKESDEEIAKVIVYGDKGSFKNLDNASWVKSSMDRLDSIFDQKSKKQIRVACQCGYGMDEKLELLKDLITSSTCIKDFASSDKAKAAGLSYQEGLIYLQFPFCPCPILEKVDRLETNTWCQCTTGYSKVLFEKAFDCEVDVELLKSIKMGDDICLMTINPHDCISAFLKRVE